MVSLLALLGAAGCERVSSAEPYPTQSASTAETSTSATSPPSSTSETSTSTPSTTPTSSPTTSTDPGCEPNPDVQILNFRDEVGPSPHQRQLDLSLSHESAAAVRCIADGDPSERHLIVTGTATDHAIQLSGLLADTDYTCEAALLCPQEPQAPTAHAFRTLEPAAGMPSITVEAAEERDGYLMTSWTSRGGCGAREVIVIYDTHGRLRHAYEHPYLSGLGNEALLSDPHTIVTGGTLPTAIVDLWDGLQYVTDLPDSQRFHHDGKWVDDQYIMTMEDADNQMDGTWFLGIRLRIHNPVTGEIVWDWNSQQGVDQGALPYFPGWKWGEDMWHPNWFDHKEGPSGPTVYVSLCASEQIIAIDPDSGLVKWVFGVGGGFDLFDAAGEPLPDSEYPQCQHGIEVEGDRMLIYDNGWHRGYSRATEYQIDPQARTAHLLWTWTEPDWFETTLGDVDYLDNGNVFVSEAHPACWEFNIPDDHTTMVEVNPETQEVVWRATFDDPNDAIYRAERLGGCDVFHHASYCDGLSQRDTELDDLFTP
jgi:hypothetical protein